MSVSMEKRKDRKKENAAGSKTLPTQLRKR
jgi:hypothetical protein